MSKHRKFWREDKPKKGTFGELEQELSDEVKIHKDCGCMAGITAELTIPWDIWQKWLCISSQMKHLEWGAVYDVVPIEELDDKIKGYLVAAFRVPKQVVSGVSCHFEEELGGNGVVHSHHSMGAFHSATDDASTRNLFDWSIVLSEKGYEACRRVKMKCGDYTYIPVTLNFTGIPEMKMKNIREETPIVQSGGYFHGSGSFYNYRGSGYDDLSHFNQIGKSPCEGCTKDCYGCKEFKTD